MSNSIDRIYHPFWKWEEHKFNMWGTVPSSERAKIFNKAIRFTKDHKKYGRYMRKVANKWTYSCEHNLSNKEQNRRAWIGHAACALAFECPEDIVRSAWSYLTKKEQIAANNEADIAIKEWEEKWLREHSE